MPAVSGAPADFDFWEFVNCSVCHLEFVKESGALSSIPFWLSECGHVICNAHLSESIHVVVYACLFTLPGNRQMRIKAAQPVEAPAYRSFPCNER